MFICFYHFHPLQYIMTALVDVSLKLLSGNLATLGSTCFGVRSLKTLIKESVH